ncbi:MAG: Lrp/AsnC family transcriptional regulator [Rhodospirillaceae bacterium]|nr:Lrp/AsnC family transcriptional regulator [Rhodospirillaceae bacterium]
MNTAVEQSLDQHDKDIINALQGGFPICERPYLAAAKELNLTEDELIKRIESLLGNGALSRFGPLINAERMGGGLTLAALAVDEENFDRVAELVNAHEEIAHNYEREHGYNMWFVIATETPEQVAQTIKKIELETGLVVLNVPKLEEFFIGLRFDL